MAAPAQAPAAAERRWFDRGAPGLADRMPLFREAMGLVAEAWTDGFAAMTATPAGFSLAGLSEARVAGLAARRGRDPAVALLDAPGWGATVMLQFDRAFVAAAVEALFGGEGGEGEAPPEGPLTAVERRIAEVVALQASDALRAGFSAVLPSSFPFDRVQLKPDFSSLGRPNAAVVVATLRLGTLGRSAEIDVLVARAALDAFADRLSVLPADEPENTDPRWSERLGSEVGRAPVALTAVVEVERMTLAALAALRPGHVLPLPPDAATGVKLLCGERALFRCDLGQAGGRYTVRVGEPEPAAGRRPGGG